LKRKFKGPLYNEAGRLCLDLTEKYIPIESFRMQTRILELIYNLNRVQAERIIYKKKMEEKQ